MSEKPKTNYLNGSLGIAFVSMSIYTFFNPEPAPSEIIFGLGCIAVADGAADIAISANPKNENGFASTASLVIGTHCILAGCMLLLHRIIGRWVFGMVLPAWIIGYSVSRLLNDSSLRNTSWKYAPAATLLLSTGGIVIGALLVFHPAGASGWFGYLAASALAAHGLCHIVDAMGAQEQKTCAASPKSELSLCKKDFPAPQKTSTSFHNHLIGK